MDESPASCPVQLLSDFSFFPPSLLAFLYSVCRNTPRRRCSRSHFAYIHAAVFPFLTRYLGFESFPDEDLRVCICQGSRSSRCTRPTVALVIFEIILRAARESWRRGGVRSQIVESMAFVQQPREMLDPNFSTVQV